MNGNWTKVLLFSILFLILGFLLGRTLGPGCGGGSCGSGPKCGQACDMHDGMGGDACMRGKKGKCCTMKGDAAPGGGMADSTAVAH